jgi:hypothetical protein
MKYLEKYNTMDLVVTFGALSIIPENHGMNTIIDYLTIEALKSYDGKWDKEMIDAIELRKYLDQSISEIEFENATTLFTQNIINEVGNNTVFSGLYENGVEVLQTQINTINQLRNSLSEKFKAEVLPAINLMLFLSNTISEINLYSRNMYISTDEKIEITLKTSDALNRIKSSLVFTLEFLEKICRLINVDLTVLDSFLLDFYDVDNFLNTIDNTNNPIYLKPLIKVEAAYLLISPTNIVSSLVHFIWKKCIEFDCVDLIMKGFHSEIDQTIFYRIRNFGLKEESIVQKDLMQVNEFNSCSFIIDSDKLVSIVFINDLGVGYNSESLFDENFYTTTGKEEDYIKEINGKLKVEHPDYKILSIALFSSIGRDFYTMYSDLGSEYFIQIPSFDFLNFSRCEEIDWVDIWYFMIVLEDFKVSSSFGVQFDFIDLYHLYKNRNHSFYLDDRIPKDSKISIDIKGEGKSNYVKGAIIKTDRHIVPYINDDGKYVGKIAVERFPGSEKYIERYYVEKLPKDVEYHISGLPFDFWIKADINKTSYSSDGLEIYYQIIEAICFWLSELKQSLIDLIKQECAPIKIILSISDFSKFNEYANRRVNKSSYFESSVQGSMLKIIISSEITYLLCEPDNQGERMIMNYVLKSIFEKINNELHLEIKEKDLNDILIKIMPHGRKKMLLFIRNNTDITLFQLANEKFRLIKESRIQYYMDRLPEILGKKYPKEGEILEKKVKKQFIIDVVACLLNTLQEKVKKINHYDLIKFVMLNCDAGWFGQAQFQLRMHTRKLCFSNKENLDIETEIFYRESDMTMICNRVLIEHLCSEFKEGSKSFSLQDFDDSIAIIQLIVFYGQQGDALNHDLFDVRLSILPSGRIGSNYHEFVNGFFDHYKAEKYRQNISVSNEIFEKHFEIEEDEGESTFNFISIDSAFKHELDVSFTNIVHFIDLLIEHAVSRKLNIVELSMDELINITTSNGIVSKVEAMNSFEFLHLWNRGNVRNVPKGYETFDISPWRYNRRLSYLQKPLIFVSKKEGDLIPKVLFTPRHLEITKRFLSKLLSSNRLNLPEGSKITSALGGYQKQRSKTVVDKTKDWLKIQNKNVSYREEVWIGGPKQVLRHFEDIGDIDLLVIDNERKIFISMECKRTEEARNINQVFQQKVEYLDKEKAYLKKHYKRHEYLISDITELGRVFNIKKSEYKIYSCLISYEILAIQFLPNIQLPMPVISLFELENMSYDKFLEKIKNLSNESNM